jgi:hypothetical protein
MVVPNNCTILTIRNRHRQPGPDLQPIVGQDCYVSYFENAHGNQWIFVRPNGADRATLYGSTANWHPHEVYERGAEQLAGPEVVLDGHERSWLRNTWETSESRTQTG